MIHRESWGRNIILCVSLMAGCSAAALAADTITGIVRNRTRGRLAVGDEVILLRIDQDMREEARTTTDTQGLFTLKVRFPDKLHVLRVLHQGVNYDQRASTGDNVSLDVFDAAAKVQGIAGSIEIIRTGTNGPLLHVSDMVEIKNDSSPPLTQVDKRTFEVYLPTHARIDSVLAASSGKIGVMISAAPVPRQPGHYTVDFPLRPGATRFAFNYDLFYDGHATFRPRSVYPLQQLAVMIPPTMKFSSPSPAFQVLRTGDNSYQVEAANQLKAGDGPSFEVSGVGALPTLQAHAESPPIKPVTTFPTPAPSASGNSGSRTQGANALGVLPAYGMSSSSSRRQWWALGASALLATGACGFLLWRRQRPSANPVDKTEQPGQTADSRVEVLKEELFQLEIDRSHGTISGDEYASAKQALEGTVKRAQQSRVF